MVTPLLVEDPDFPVAINSDVSLNVVMQVVAELDITDHEAQIGTLLQAR